MKKTKFLCFLGLLCLFGSMVHVYGQKNAPDPDISGKESPDPGKSGNDTGPAVIFGMVTEYSNRDKVNLEIYNGYYFHSPKAPRSNFITMPLQPGRLMEGAYPKDKTFQYNLPDLNRDNWVSLKLEDSDYILDRVLVQPGDTVQVYIDLEKCRVLFAGPDAMKFKLQYELKNIAREIYLNNDRVMVTDDPSQVLKDPVHGADYLEVLAGAGPRMVFVARGREEIARLTDFDPHKEGEVLEQQWAYLESMEGHVDGGYLNFFRKECELRAWKQHLAKISSAMLFADRRGDGRTLEALKNLGKERIAALETFLETDLSPASAMALDYADEKSLLISRIHDISKVKAVSWLREDWLREKMLVRLFYKNYETIKEVDSALDSALAEVKGEKQSELLLALSLLKRTGTPVNGFVFLDGKGDSVRLEQLDGDIFLVEFWISGCKVCIVFNEQALALVRERFAGNNRLHVITVSADFNTGIWKKSLESGRYTHSDFTNLYTGEENRNHPFLRNYGISSFPNRILLDGKGRILMASNVPFDGRELVGLIESFLEKDAMAATE